MQPNHLFLGAATFAATWVKRTSGLKPLGIQLMGPQVLFGLCISDGVQFCFRQVTKRYRLFPVVRPSGK